MVKKKQRTAKSKESKSKGQIDTFGGQALIEGVMMRNKTHYSVACRKPDGKIIVKKHKIKSVTQKFPLLGKPFIRGAVGLFEMLIIGMKALSFSANQQAETKEEELSKKEIGWTIAFAFGVSALLFIVAPYFLTGWFIEGRGFLFNFVDGIIRLVFFLIYIIVISFMSDVRRLFQYHGAEHKTVFCHEHNQKLTVANVKPFTTLHPRCGTSFLVIVLGLSIVVFSFIKTPLWYLNIPLRLLLVPVVAGISYELLKTSARYQDNWFFRIFTKPGLWVQKITTKEPDKKQIEVAIAALQALL